MRLGLSVPLTHSSPEEWADRQRKLGCSTIVFPVQKKIENELRFIMSSTGFRAVKDIDNSALCFL